MAKLAVMMSSNETDGAMSLHFGKAEWVMVVDPASRTAEFARNEGLNGRSAADLLICRGCTDLMLVGIGDGALARLQAANIRVWAVPSRVTGSEALCMFAEGKIPRVPATPAAASRGQGHGCCCGGQGGSHAAAGGCR
jgi:predicted Fe-Mo cluster-binding NifX family protein